MKRGDTDKRGQAGEQSVPRTRPQFKPKANRYVPPRQSAAPAKPRDPLVKPKANDVVRSAGQPCGTYTVRKVFSAKGGSVVYQINGGPFNVDTAEQWAKWAAGGTVVALGVS